MPAGDNQAPWNFPFLARKSITVWFFLAPMKQVQEVGDSSTAETGSFILAMKITRVSPTESQMSLALRLLRVLPQNARSSEAITLQMHLKQNSEVPEK